MTDCKVVNGKCEMHGFINYVGCYRNTTGAELKTKAEQRQTDKAEDKKMEVILNGFLS